MNKYRKIAIKVGSNVLTKSDGMLNITRISHIVDQIAEIRESGVEVILISSGAVAAGRKVLMPEKKLDEVSQRQLWSSLGQVQLINTYNNFFSNYNIPCAQVLTTKENFSSRRHYLNMKNCITALLSNSVIPIVNENDTISVTELMFTDNDELSGLIASMMGMDALIILSNVDGIYSGHPDDRDSEVIRSINGNYKDFIKHIRTSKSSFGRGGMQTKFNISRKTAMNGVDVHIANGNTNNIIKKISFGEKCISTCFESKNKASDIKQWISHSEGFAKASVIINKGAIEALTSERANSLLPVGVTKIKGEFEKNDIIKIETEDNKVIGVGKAQYCSDSANNKIGQKGHKALIHYDYLTLIDV